MISQSQKLKQVVNIEYLVTKLRNTIRQKDWSLAKCMARDIRHLMQDLEKELEQEEESSP